MEATVLQELVHWGFTAVVALLCYALGKRYAWDHPEHVERLADAVADKLDEWNKTDNEKEHDDK
jgi:hypothetical protein